MKNRIDGARLAGRLSVRGDWLTRLRVEAAIARLMARATPEGIRAEAIFGGIALYGRSLRRRMITDPNIRNWHR